MTPRRRLFELVTSRRLAVWAAGVLVLTWGLYAYTMATPGLVDRDRRFKATDFIQFYVMGSFVLEGRPEALYDADAHLAQGRRRIDPELGIYAGHANYGPQVALLFAPFALLPYGPAAALFLALSVVLYAVAVRLLWRECEALWPHGRLVALIAAASPLFAVVIRYGQLSTASLLIWVLAMVAYRRDRRFASGLAIGCLAFKPQFGIVIGVVLLVAREWRVVGGAVAAVAAQLAVGWLVAGSTVMGQYFTMLGTLMMHPQLVQLFPSELHSLRGFFQLLLLPPALVTLCSLAGTAAALTIGVASWRRSTTTGMKFGQVVLLTVLASPHLLSYDLVLLTIPLIVFANWSARTPDDPMGQTIALLLVPLYFAPLSSNLARVIQVQVSVVVMVALAVCVYRANGRQERR